MANSTDTKKAIKLEIERLSNQKRSLKRQLDPLKLRVDSIKNRIDAIVASIIKLEADLNG
jgi:uncharacterized coiled-coil DUF342 family protein